MAATRITPTKKVRPSPAARQRNNGNGREIVPSVLAPQGGDIGEIPFHEAIGWLHQAVTFLTEQTFKLNLSVGYNPALGHKTDLQFYLHWAHADLLAVKRRLESIGCRGS